MINPEPLPPSGPSDIVNSRGTPASQAIEVLKFQDAVDVTSKLIQDTNLHKLNKGMASSLREQMVKGLKSVWIDREGASKFATTEQMAEDFRNIVDPSGLAAAKLNAPIRIDTHKALELLDQYPTLSEHLKLTPEGPSPSEAIVWHNKNVQAEAKRTDIRYQLNAHEKSPEERAAAVQINDTMSDAEISKKVVTKEVADSLLNFLDVGELKAKEDYKTNLPEQERQLKKIDNMRQRITTIKDTLPNDVTSKEVHKLKKRFHVRACLWIWVFC
jgi:hypothetical protein